jgi:phosphoglycerate dehydrogenase-like enzyme
VAFAEHTIMPISAVYRKPVALHQYVASGRWHQGIPHTVDIFELEGKAVGLVALPNIGHQVPWRIKALVRMTLPRS